MLCKLPLSLAATIIIASCAASPGPGPARSSAREAPPGYMAGGTVLGVERGSPTDPAAHVHLIIQPGEGAPVRVDLGPGWYLDERGLRFSESDRVEVEGRAERRREGDVIVARRVRKDGKTVELHDGSQTKPGP